MVIDDRGRRGGKSSSSGFRGGRGGRAAASSRARYGGGISFFGRGRGRSASSSRPHNFGGGGRQPSTAGAAGGAGKAAPSSTAYGLHFQALIEEEAAAKERWARPVKSLVADGQCITGLWAALPQSHTTGRVVELRLPFWKGNCALPRGHSFARGDLVRIQTQMHGKAANSNSPPQGSETPQTLEGVVADVGPELIRVEIEAMGLMEEGAIANQINIARAGKRTWRLDKGFSTVTFERMLAAMSALTRKHSAVMDFILATHPSETPQLDAKLPALPALTIQAARECDASDLNPSQAQALEAMRNNRLTLIQGPPGTGKTQTCASVLCEMAEMYGKGQVLACAFNNVAIDELSKRVKAVGGRQMTVVRLGEPSRNDPEAMELALDNLESSRVAAIREEMKQVQQQVTEQRRARDAYHITGTAAHKAMKKAEQASAGAASRAKAIRQGVLARPRAGEVSAQVQSDRIEGDKKRRQLEAEMQALAAIVRQGAQEVKEHSAKKRAAFAQSQVADQAVGRLLGKLKALQYKLQQIREELLDTADVVCCTCIGAATKELKGRTFSAILVDECTQALEPACIIPLLKLQDSSLAARVVLAGDHKQLPPTVVSSVGVNHPLSRSLFERLIELAGTTTTSLASPVSPAASGLASMMLSIQYRMHPDISRFPALHFYGGRLTDGVDEADRGMPMQLLEHAMRKVGIAWPGHGPRSLFVDIDTMQPHGAAAELQADTSKINYASATVVRKLVAALITERVVNSTAEIGVITPYSKQQKLISNGRLMDGRCAPLADGVEIKTVDGFQGREKSVIVFDTVRCNKEARIGFLQDERRLNVAITRAQRLLVMVGSLSTLANSTSGAWQQLMLHYEQSNGIVSLA